MPDNRTESDGPSPSHKHNPFQSRNRLPAAAGWNWTAVLRAVLLGLLFIYLMQLFLPDVQTEKISYSAFKKAVRQDRVAEVTLRGNRIMGRYRAVSGAQGDAGADGQQGQAAQPAEAQQDAFSTFKPALEDPDLLKLLEKNDVTIHARADDGNWMWLLLAGFLPWVLIIGVMMYSAHKMRQRMGGGGPGRIFGFGKSKAKRISPQEVDVTYDDVAGLENAKKELREIVLYLKSPTRFEAIGAELPKGMLLIGPPGVGKTLLARAIAGEADVPFFSISGSEFIEMFVGVGASRVRDLFEQAKRHAPAIIFVDELDSIGRVRGTGVGGGHDEREQTLNQILSQMDGFSPREAVIVLAATNRPDVLDPALTRPGRFDRRITLDLPRKGARLEILKTHTRNVPLADDVDLENIAERTVGMSGADLKNLVNEAALLSARERQERCTMAQIEAARDKVLMGIEREEMVSDTEREVIAYHEAGHALVAKLHSDTDPLQKVTIIPRGRALGATEQLPIEDRRNLNRGYLLSRVAVMMGGRVAERMQFGEVSTGGGNDLKQATQLVRRMVCEWGMSELGPIAFGGSQHQPFLGRELSQQKEFSEHSARLIDEQVLKILFEQEKTAERLLSDNQQRLRSLAEALLDQEVVTNQEVDRLLESTAPTSAN